MLMIDTLPSQALRAFVPKTEIEALHAQFDVLDSKNTGPGSGSVQFSLVGVGRSSELASASEGR